MTNEDKKLAPDQMTSADYYFDSYAHFGKNVIYYQTLPKFVFWASKSVSLQ